MVSFKDKLVLWFVHRTAKKLDSPTSSQPLMTKSQLAGLKEFLTNLGVKVNGLDRVASGWVNPSVRFCPINGQQCQEDDEYCRTACTLKPIQPKSQQASKQFRPRAAQRKVGYE